GCAGPSAQPAAALKAARKHKAPIIAAKLDRLSRDVHFISGLMSHKTPFIVADADPFNAAHLRGPGREGASLHLSLHCPGAWPRYIVATEPVGSGSLVIIRLALKQIIPKGWPFRRSRARLWPFRGAESGVCGGPHFITVISEAADRVAIRTSLELR